MTDVDATTPLEEAEADGAVAAGPSVPDAHAIDDSPHDRDGADRSADELSRPIELALGAVRLGVGAALVAAPGWAGRIWVGPGADGPGSKVFARALGARDVALGLRILQGAQKGEPVAHWVAAGFAADFADVAATIVAAKHLTPGRRIAMPLIAGAVGAAGVVAARKSQAIA